MIPTSPYRLTLLTDNFRCGQNERRTLSYIASRVYSLARARTRVCVCVEPAPNIPTRIK